MAVKHNRDKDAEVEHEAKVELTPEGLAGMIDHALLRPEKSSKDFVNLCNEAKKYRFFSVCVNPYWVKFCSDLLKGTDVKVVSVVSFPFGQMTSKMKALETKETIDNGASEVDMVMNLGAFKSRNYDYVQRDIAAVVAAAEGKIVKVIIESGYLTDGEIVKACEIVRRSGAHFAKTSTGFGPLGATVRHVSMMRKAVGPDFGVKASGGIRSYCDAVNMVAAGANRIGSSESVKIIEDCKSARKGWL